jgi:glutamyl-tRNA reductase
VHILLTGLNHKTASLDLRERIAFTAEQLSEALPILRGDVGEAVILSTCNRTEVYIVSNKPSLAASGIRTFLAGYHGLDGTLPPDSLQDLVDADAVRHLFRVAGGLDSMIIGESQILGQVRGALAAAAAAETLSAPVSRLFHRAIRAGRRVRDETDVGRNALSVSFAAVRLAEKVLGGLTDLRVLLIGVGDAGELVARALQTTGIGELVITNRTSQRAQELAEEIGGSTVPFERLDTAVADADIVIAATEALDYILTAETISRTNGRRGQGTFMFDLGLPRNIDPEVASIDGVSLFNIDDLAAVAEENLRERWRSAAAAEAVVEDEVTRFVDWWETRDALPLITELRERSEEMRQREMSRALEKMNGISETDSGVIDDMTRAIVNKLLHSPTVSLKQRSDEETLRAARELFGLHGGPD